MPKFVYVTYCGLCVAETRSPKSHSTITEWKLLMSSSDIQKYRIFSHFWEKGYFLTGGGKFGGDFLIYPGTLVNSAFISSFNISILLHTYYFVIY